MIDLTESSRLSKDVAESQSLFLRDNITNRQFHDAFIGQVSQMSNYPERQLQDLIDLKGEDWDPDMAAGLPQLKKTAEIALAVKANPTLLEEMKNNPSHSRLLDLHDVSLDMLLKRKPEIYMVALDRVNLVAELVQEIGKEKLKRVTEAISALSQGLLGVNIVRMSEPFSNDQQLTWEVWGKIFALVASEVQLNELKQREEQSSSN